MKWVLCVLWPLAGHFTALQQFPTGPACTAQAEKMAPIYEGKGTLACELRWSRTR